MMVMTRSARPGAADGLSGEGSNALPSGPLAGGMAPVTCGRAGNGRAGTTRGVAGALAATAGSGFAGVATCGGAGVGRLRVSGSYQTVAPITTAAVAIPSTAAATEWAMGRPAGGLPRPSGA